jgi:LacI family transcriptional regulator
VPLQLKFMNITQQEIAKSLGVSRQMVTYALNGGGTVSNQRRREIIEAAERMGYRRNELARAMVTGKSRIVGILTNSTFNDAMALTIAGALEEAASHDYSTKLMFLPFDADEAQAQQVVQRCSSWRLDGVLVVGLSDHHVEILRDEMDRGNRPIAFAGNLPPEGAIGAYSDDDGAWRLAVQHLFDLGHRRIAHLGARPTSKLACSRMQSCLNILREFGLPVDEHSSTFTSWNEIRPIEEGVARLLDAPQPPTALLCSGDSLAMTAMRVARRRGIVMPEKLSIVGFGDTDTAKFADPALTSISQPHEEVARVAMRQLLVHVEAGAEDILPAPQRQGLTTGCRLIVRESTARPA